MSEPGTELKKGPKQKKKRRGAFWLVVLIVLTAFTAACGFYSYQFVLKSIAEKDKVVEINIPPEKGIYIDIPLGSNTDAIARILEKNGFVKYPLLFKIMSKFNGYDGRYKSGTHIVSQELDYDKLMRVLTGNPVSIKVMIPEGYTYTQTIDLLAKKNLIDRTRFEKVASTEKFDYKFLQGLPQREFRLEGYLFPDTYEFDMKAGEKEVLKRMLGNFNAKFKPEYYQKAKDLNMTVDQVVILASIIEREAQIAEERKIISGVFHNRLKSKDKSLRKLQSCATVQYIYLNKEGRIKEKLTEADVAIQHPYNTYLNEGLPPGPICSPGIDAIEAALNPQKSDNWFFVAKGDGTHQFSKTLAEHNAAVKKYGLK